MQPILVGARRGATVESVHRVDAVALERGARIAEAGDPGLVTFVRSCAKPFQALPLVRAVPDLSEEELAIACASHQAEPAQLDAVLALLRRARASEADLECGFQEGRPRDQLAHNCSGQHAGFLVLCRVHGWLPPGYRLPPHPVQRAMLREIAEATSLASERIPLADDGCGIVTFGLSLERIAAAFGRLGDLDGGARVAAAIRARPDLIGGEGAADTALMRALPGWVAKRGAEGLFCAVSPDGVAVALKVEDGAQRAVRPALAAFLDRLGVELGDDFRRVPIESSRGDPVGEVVVL